MRYTKTDLIAPLQYQTRYSSYLAMLVLRVYSESFGVWLHQPVSLYFSLSFLHAWWVQIFSTASHLPQSILLCKVYAKAAPPGMESAVFSYTVGISNFCGMVSTLLASGIVKWSGMVTIGNDCNFIHNLPSLFFSNISLN